MFFLNKSTALTKIQYDGCVGVAKVSNKSLTSGTGLGQLKILQSNSSLEIFFMLEYITTITGTMQAYYKTGLI